MAYQRSKWASLLCPPSSLPGRGYRGKSKIIQWTLTLSAMTKLHRQGANLGSLRRAKPRQPELSILEAFREEVLTSCRLVSKVRYSAAVRFELKSMLSVGRGLGPSNAKARTLLLPISPNPPRCGKGITHLCAIL